MSTSVSTRHNADRPAVEAVLDDGSVAGYAHYRRQGEAYVFDHTVVEPAHEGRGIGSQLAAGVMEFVREQGATVVPECSFIRAYMAKHDETRDLLDDQTFLD